MSMGPKEKPFELARIDVNHLSDNLSPPTKRIESGQDLVFFLRSKAYHDLTLWILQLTRSCLPQTLPDGQIRLRKLDEAVEHGPTVLAVQSIITKLDKLVDETPPEPGPRRFGNVAFRTWSQRVEESILSELEAQFTSLTPEQLREPSTLQIIFAELKAYLIGSFGSAQRLDNGTGHELSYIAFVGILWKCGFLQPGDEWSIVSGTIQPYFSLVRRLIKTYNLEPAGSHGVWGLDDHSFIPYIFGSAQLSTPLPAVTSAEHPPPPMPIDGSVHGAPDPASITSIRSVEEQKSNNFYFGAVGFILDVKRGPFFEHSPYLYNISGIKDGWGKINKGMLKMYDAEVLGKFPVVQHFPFGNFWRWDQDPSSSKVVPSNVHTVNQPQSQATGQATGQSTKAPWASQSSSLPSLPTLGPPRPSTTSRR